MCNKSNFQLIMVFLFSILVALLNACSSSGSSAGDTTGAPVPTISLSASITADNVIDHIEQLNPSIAITGTVGGDAKIGDIVNINVNNVNSSGVVLADKTFSINVNGSSLIQDTDRTVEATVITTIDGVTGIATDTQTYQVDISGGVGGNTLVCPDPLQPICFDIIYVRYPIAKTAATKLNIPSAEIPYRIVPGADLMLLKQDGSETVLVDCDTDCSVMDPYISYDGKTVYYALYERYFNNPFGDDFASWIYKIHLEEHEDFNNFAPIRLTYDDGFDSVLYQANRDVDGKVKAGHDQRQWRAIRDMAPVPLADGRLLFTSNRSALTALHPLTDSIITGSVQQMYVMDDHDGTEITRELANIQRLETGNLHMVQHPIQLKDGRIIFSTWQDASTKMDGLSFMYAMMPLFTVHPDGSNLQQFTEPHDHHKNSEHFITQLPNEQVIWGHYYPNLEGFGILMRAPVASDGPDFLRGSVSQISTYDQLPISYREFDRKGTVTITPHTSPGDSVAPNLSGKYAMPNATNSGNLLVSYSTGAVNQTNFACAPSGLCENLKAGIYLIKNAGGSESDYITDPASQLIRIKDDPNFNEIWPRAVLSYQDIYGQTAPNIINNLALSLPEDIHLQPAEANAIVGTSSLYNRQSGNDDFPDGLDKDPFLSNLSRESNAGNWLVQGAEAGLFTNDDIYGVRIIATTPKPYTKPIDRFLDTARWNSVLKFLHDTRLEYVVSRYHSNHGERWDILGEFPVRKSGVVTDGNGDPDTSWLAKIPAETPFIIQAIDDKGMTLTSEMTWRALKPGEKRADCGGCHAHSIDPVDIATTKAGINAPIDNVIGVSSADARVKDGIWDLTLNSIPLLNDTGVMFKQGYSYGVEFNRDIVPILNNRCVSCHTAGQSGAKMILDNDPWTVIAKTGGFRKYLQPSDYIRTAQARQSLFVWAVWGERLDGRLNTDRDNDIDFNGHPGITGLTDEEKRTISRWVDLGSPINFPVTNGMGYTDDVQLPIVNIYRPSQGDNNSSQLQVGLNDALSGLDINTLKVKYFKIDASITSQYPDLTNIDNVDAAITTFKQVMAAAEQSVTINTIQDINVKNVLTKDLALGAGEYVVTVSINDLVGNTGVSYRRFTIK